MQGKPTENDRCLCAQMQLSYHIVTLQYLWGKPNSKPSPISPHMGGINRYIKVYEWVYINLHSRFRFLSCPLIFLHVPFVSHPVFLSLPCCFLSSSFLVLTFLCSSCMLFLGSFDFLSLSFLCPFLVLIFFLFLILHVMILSLPFIFLECSWHMFKKGNCTVLGSVKVSIMVLHSEWAGILCWMVSMPFCGNLL